MKLRAHNSKKKNYNPKKVERHLKYIEEKTNEYLNQLDKNDRSETPIKIKSISEKIERLKKNKIKYELLSEKLGKSRSPQISTTDEDSRAFAHWRSMGDFHSKHRARLPLLFHWYVSVILSLLQPKK